MYEMNLRTVIEKNYIIEQNLQNQLINNLPEAKYFNNQVMIYKSHLWFN